MRRVPGAIALVGFIVMSLAIARAADAGRFDGTWQTTVSCAPVRDALGYSFRFASEVRGGVLHGLHQTPDGGGSLAIDGRIAPDGSARLYAAGRTGSKEFVPGRDTPRGTEYGYDIEARFDNASGTGTRLEGRPCTVQLVRLP